MATTGLLILSDIDVEVPLEVVSFWVVVFKVAPLASLAVSATTGLVATGSAAAAAVTLLFGSTAALSRISAGASSFLPSSLASSLAFCGPGAGVGL